MPEKRHKCPDCGEHVRACNLERHRRSHLPTAVSRGFYTYWAPAKRPLMQHRTHDTRYDEVAPRGEGMHRFRVYRLRGGELQLLATTVNAGNMGNVLVDLKKRGEFIPDDATGVLDTDEEPGGWIVHPFALGRTRREAA